MKQFSKLKGWNRIETIAIAAILILFALAPIFIHNPYYLNILVMTVIYAYMGSSWNLLGGFAGQLFIGGGVIFFGIGAYTSTILLVRYGVSPWIGMLCASAVSTAFAFLVAKLTLRYSLKGDYLALFSVALAQVMALIFINVDFLGGAYGFNLPITDDSLALMTWADKRPYLYIGLAMLTGLLCLIHWLQRTKAGKYWVAIRENDTAAETLGVDTARYKMYAMLLCGAMGGMGGTLYAQYTTFIDPNLVFGLPLNFEFIMPVLIGGKGTILGPLLGASVLKPLSEIIRSTFGNARAGLYLMIYGVLLVVTIIYLPDGVVGLARRLYDKKVKKEQKEAVAHNSKEEGGK